MNGIRNTVSAVGEIAREVVTQVGVQVSAEALTGTLRAFADLEEKYEGLKRDQQLLRALKNDIEREVQRCREKDTTSSYSLWITMVSEVDAKVNDLITKYETEMQTSNRFWLRPTPSLCSEIERKIVEIQQLHERGSSMVFQVDRPPEGVLMMLNAPDISCYPTLQGALNKILELLKNSKIKAVGVYGMKGVGKTAIMQNLNNNEEVAKLFDIVIFASVSADLTDLELQQKIARRLKVDAGVINDPEGIARKIHEELKDKKYLLIFDEVADSIDLNQIGIPNNDNHSKIVVTAQHPQVCTLNEADRLIKVDLLSRDEAWKMFQNTVGPIIDRPDIPEIAQRVCDKCSCLPLLIQKIARSFKLKGSASSWRAGLEDLEERWPDYENEGVNELYSFLTFCYDELKDKEKQKCFLYTSLYPANCKVYSDYLVECWAAQDFLGDVNDTRKYQNARDRGYAILEHLSEVSLLEKGKQMIYVSMNDCMKQLALHISSKYPECGSCVQSREEFGETPKSWQNARWVSLIDSNLKTLPTNQDCSMLVTLLLQKNSELSTIPALFFKKHMRALLVLDLYDTGIKSLPSSVSRLIGLKGLYLNDCKNLTSLSCGIRSLGLLEFLDIRGTKVTFLSSDIGHLTNLRCLRIPYIKSAGQSEDRAVNADYGAISKLQKLEELIIEVVSYQKWCNDAANVMWQLASLENLTNLRFSFPSSNILENLLTRRAGKQFTSFRFFVGCQNSKHPPILESFEYRVSKYLRYNNGEKEDTSAISVILPQTDAFELINCNHITELSNIGTESLKRVRGILIERCSEIHTLLPGIVNGSRDVTILPNLEQLHLIDLSKLNSVFGGPMHHGSLSKLKVLKLKNCSSLKYIFGNGSIQQFSELKVLEVQTCSDFEELIVAAEIGGNELPKLEVLVLADLPRFRSVCIDETLPWSSLEVLRMYKCPGLKSLPFGKEKATNLRSIQGEQEWWDELQWADKEHFQPIFVASSEY